MVLDALARQLHAPLSRSAHGAAYAATRLGEHSVLLVKPMTFMNRSGAPLAALTQRHNIPPHRTLVVHDCLDLPLGAIRLRAGGSAGGHNGMRSVMATLGGGKASAAPAPPAKNAGRASCLSAPLPRLRVGIGRPEGRQGVADFVLEAFSRREQEVLEVDIARAVDAIQAVVALGLEAAMAGGRVGRAGRETPAAKAGQKREREEGGAAS